MSEGIRVRFSIGGVPRWLKVGIDIIQGDLAIRLVWTEKRAHNGYSEQTTVEDVDPHGCDHRYHRDIQHWVKASMPYREPNEYHHRAQRRHPLETTQESRSGKYKIFQYDRD